MEIVLNDTCIVPYCQSDAIKEIENINETSFYCVSDFDLQSAVNVKDIVDAKFYSSDQECDKSLFTNKVKEESIIGYALKCGQDEASISLWKLVNVKFGSDSILRIFQGKGRVLRFKNKSTGLINDLKLEFDSTWLYLSKSVLDLFTFEFPNCPHIKNSTFVYFNVLLMDVPVATGTFAALKEGMETRCCICIEEYTTESVFYPHDEIHPMCTNCAFTLMIRNRHSKCPICRTDIVY